MVFVARDQGHDGVYAAPKEGYLLWAVAGAEPKARQWRARGILR